MQLFNCEIETFAILILFMNVIFPKFAFLLHDLSYFVVGPGKIFVTTTRLDVLNFYAKEKKTTFSIEFFLK